MNRNYLTASQMGLTEGSDIQEWADSRETALPVAIAIHAISEPTTGRTAEEIWEDPKPAEWDHVKMAVNEYITYGDFPPADDNRYQWGEETLDLST